MLLGGLVLGIASAFLWPRGPNALPVEVAQPVSTQAEEAREVLEPAAVSYRSSGTNATAVLDELAVEPATHRAVGDGAWQDGKSWGAEPPKDGARVIVPAGQEIVVRSVLPVHLQSLVIEGTLRFAHDVPTAITVDTLLVAEGGTLIIGTEAQPVESEVQALVSILPFQDPDMPAEDRAFSATFTSFGTVSMHGAEKTGLLALTQIPEPGDRSLALSEEPWGWQEEDLVVIGGNFLPRAEADVLYVSGVEGSHVLLSGKEDAWDGVSADYTPDQDRLAFAINITRNVAIASRPPRQGEPVYQGAVLFAGDGVANASLANVGFYGLGQVEGSEDGLGTEDTRHALEFRDGTGAAILEGVVLVDAPDSKVTIFRSDVAVANSVAYDTEGGAWLTEQGQPSRLLWAGQRTAPAALRSVNPE